MHFTRATHFIRITSLHLYCMLETFATRIIVCRVLLRWKRGYSRGGQCNAPISDEAINAFCTANRNHLVSVTTCFSLKSLNLHVNCVHTAFQHFKHKKSLDRRNGKMKIEIQLGEVSGLFSHPLNVHVIHTGHCFYWPSPRLDRFHECESSRTGFGYFVCIRTQTVFSDAKWKNAVKNWPAAHTQTKLRQHHRVSARKVKVVCVCLFKVRHTVSAWWK